VLVVWLAGQVSAQTRTGLRLLTQHSQGKGVSFVDDGTSLVDGHGHGQILVGVNVPQAELDVALAALARPQADIAARVAQSWTTLSDPGTTTAQAAQILGVPAPATRAEDSTQCR
jgi:hypothetical protein